MTGHPSKAAVHLVKSLLSYCGIDAATDLEDESRVLLSIDYETSLLIVVENRLLHLVASLGPVVETGAFYRRLLEENFAGCVRSGYRYSLDPVHGELLVSLTVSAEDMQPDEFIDAFDAFVRLSEKWIKSLAAGREDIPDKDIDIAVADVRGTTPDLRAGDLGAQIIRA